MTRRLRSRSARVRAVLALICAALLGGAWPAVVGAQGSVATEGALFLLVPVGARTVAQGQAGVASRLGADGVFWNPAASGWLTRRELTVDHGSNAFITSDAISAVIPAGMAGTLAVALHYFNFGDQTATDEFGNSTGTIYARAMVLGGTYAATFGDRVSAGVSYKFIRNEQSCGGACAGLQTYSISTTAYDFGVQAVVDTARKITAGVALRNAGFGLQTVDREQADPLPARLHAGLTWEVDAVTRAAPGVSLALSGELVTKSTFRGVSYRVGGEAWFADRFAVRAGFITNSGDRSNAAIGFGLRQGTLGLEFARTFGGESADAGSPPTYVTLRIGFK